MSRAEARLGHDVVGQRQRDAVGDDRVVALGDVAERPGVHEHRATLEVLHQVRLDRVAHEHGHGTCAAEVLGGHRGTGAGLADHDATKAGPHVVKVGGHGEHRHDFRGHRDVVAGLARHAVEPCPQPDDDVAQGAIVEVDHAPPGDRMRVDLERVAVKQVVVDVGRQQVGGHRDGVHVPGEVEVEILHRDDLRVTSTGCSALDAEDRAERRLADAGDRVLADVSQGLPQPHRRDGLALAERSGSDRGDVDVAPLRAAGEPREHLQRHLGLVLPVQLEVVDPETRLGGHVDDGPQSGGLRDFQVCLHHPLRWSCVRTSAGRCEGVALSSGRLRVASGAPEQYDTPRHNG